MIEMVGFGAYRLLFDSPGQAAFVKLRFAKRAVTGLEAGHDCGLSAAGGIARLRK
jgi:hypothetical protein